MEAIAAALVLIFVLYLIDKNQRWRQTFKLVLGLAVLSAVGLGGWVLGQFEILAH